MATQELKICVWKIQRGFESHSIRCVLVILSRRQFSSSREEPILLGLAHRFVSSGLFICAGGVLYDRSGTRLIYFYKGAAQVMPLFSILRLKKVLGIYTLLSIEWCMITNAILI